MARPTATQPTAAELAILEALWETGPCTVREVHDYLHRERRSRTGYTTVLKLMQIMTRKGLVHRDESQRTHVYTASDSRGKVQKGLVGELIDRAFAGSTSELVLRALAAKPASREELAEIRKFLDEQARDRQR